MFRQGGIFLGKSMVYEFKFPDVGEGITEGEIVRWLVKEGEIVKQDQAIGKIETDKAVVDMPSPVAGKVVKIHFKAGETVKVGQILVTILEKGGSVSPKKTIDADKIKGGYTDKNAGKGKYSGSVVGVIDDGKEIIPASSEHKTSAREKAITALPSVRKLAKDLGVDLNKFSMLGARITKEDVEAASKKTVPRVAKKYDLWGYIERVPFKGIRKTTAKNMVQSAYTIPHVTHMDEADITELVKIREKEKFNAKKKGINLTYTPFIVKAVIAALKEHPLLNSTLNEENEEIVIKKYYNIGIAVDIEDGLIVPVVKVADQKTLLQLGKEMHDLSEKAKNRTIDLGDLKGGTFTITNIGVIGGIFATPIINYPEVAILATGKIHDKPLVVNGRIEIRKVLPLSLSFDHRIIDGAEAARFVNTLKGYLENAGLFAGEVK